MARKCKCPPEGAPEWVMTYGDMMSLLLVFFIMIVSLSEIKQKNHKKAFLTAVQHSFGWRDAGREKQKAATPNAPIQKRLKRLHLKQATHPNRSKTDDPGMEGRETTVTRVREGLQFVTGGRITFDPGSADLTTYDKRRLGQVADLIRGINTIVELRGHASPMERGGGGGIGGGPVGKPRDLWKLSLARAQAAMDYLTSSAGHIRADRFRLIANADREPLAKRAYTSAKQRLNRRVEVFVTDSLVQQFQKAEATE